MTPEPLALSSDDPPAPTLQDAHDAAREGRWDRVASVLDGLMPHLDGPDVPRLWSLYAQALAHSCRIKEATSAVRRALQTEPSDAESWALLGELLHSAGDEHGALAALRRATTFDPTSAGAWGRRGVVCRVLGRVDEARACCERAVAADTTAPGAWRDLADLLRELGEIDAALDCYHALLALAPGHEDAWCDVVLIHLGRNDVVRARWTWRRAARQGEPLAARLCARVDASQGWAPGRARDEFTQE